MIRVRPQSTVFLCQTSLEPDGKNVLDFTDANAQYTYFQSTVKQAFSEYTYVRDSETIDVGVPIDTIRQCNYMFFTNTGFTTKTFYCFITDMTYLNENATRITYKTDAFQTWQFDLVRKTCFVEREHVTDDVVGRHTIPESLEIGEYVETPNSISEEANLNYLIEGTYVVLGVSDTGLNVAIPSGHEYNGVFSGLIYLTFPTPNDAYNYIRYIQDKITNDVITTAFLSPKSLVGSPSWINEASFTYAFVEPTNTKKILKSATITMPTSLDGYTPRNKKLLTFPYQYFIISNNGGTAYDYKYELFKNNTPTFNIFGALSVGCSINLIPRNYRERNISFNYTHDNYLESIPSIKLPTCGWKNNAYYNYLAQNALNIPLSIGMGSVRTLAGGITAIATGGALGVTEVIGGIGQVTNQMAEIYNRSLVPETAKGGANLGDLNFAQSLSYTLSKRTIKNEFAQIIDNYFDMFGYKVNTVKIPSLRSRTNWNYIKTIDCNFDGDIPSRDLETIRSQFNAGVTIWHNPQTMYNYNNTNGVI